MVLGSLEGVALFSHFQWVLISIYFVSTGHKFCEFVQMFNRSKSDDTKPQKSQTDRRIRRRKRTCGLLGEILGFCAKILTLAAYLQDFYVAPHPDSTKASTQKLLRRTRLECGNKIEEKGKSRKAGKFPWTYLCMHQSIVEEDEPVDGEPTSVQQGQRLVATLADQPAVRLPQRVLTTDGNTFMTSEMPRELRTYSGDLPSFCRGSSSRSERCNQPLSFSSSAG